MKPGGDRRSEDFQGGNITALKSDARDIAAAKVGVSGKVVDLAEETAESRQIKLAG